MDEDKMVGHIQGDALEAEPWDFRPGHQSEPIVTIVIWRVNLVEEASDEERELRRRARQELHYITDLTSSCRKTLAFLIAHVFCAREGARGCRFTLRSQIP